MLYGSKHIATCETPEDVRGCMTGPTVELFTVAESTDNRIKVNKTKDMKSILNSHIVSTLISYLNLPDYYNS